MKAIYKGHPIHWSSIVGLLSYAGGEGGTSHALVVSHDCSCEVEVEMAMKQAIMVGLLLSSMAEDGWNNIEGP